MDISNELRLLDYYHVVIDARPERPRDQDLYFFIQFFSKQERVALRDFLHGPILKGTRLTYMNMIPVREPFEATLKLIQELA